MSAECLRGSATWRSGQQQASRKAEFKFLREAFSFIDGCRHRLQGGGPEFMPWATDQGLCSAKPPALRKNGRPGSAVGNNSTLIAMQAAKSPSLFGGLPHETGKGMVIAIDKLKPTKAAMLIYWVQTSGRFQKPFKYENNKSSCSCYHQKAKSGFPQMKLLYKLSWPRSGTALRAVINHHTNKRDIESKLVPWIYFYTICNQMAKAPLPFSNALRAKTAYS